MKYKNHINLIKKINEPIAIVINCYVTGLSVIRNLGRQGVPVIGLDPNPIQIGFFSKYCIGIQCPDPYKNENEFTQFLISLGETLNEKGVLFPCDDMYSLIILKNRKELEKYFYFIMPEEDISLNLINKHIFYKTLEKLGIDHPKNYYKSDFNEIFEIFEKIKFPCYIKPVYSSFFKKDFDVKMFIANNKKELLFYYKKATEKNHEVIIQEFIPGYIDDNYCLNAYYNKDFEPIGIFSSKRRREWPIMRGCGCLIEKISDTELIEKITYLMKNIGYFGIIDAEFKLDLRDNKFKLIEINARPWMQIGLCSKFGINHCYIAYLDAIGKKYDFKLIESNYYKWLFFYDDIKASITMALKNQVTFKEWIKSLKGKKEYAFFSKDDLLPFIIYTSKLILKSPIYYLSQFKNL